MQKPQCTQARRIFSEAAICGSSSCVRVNEVCMRYTPAHMRPGLSTAFGSKLSFTRLVSACNARLLRREDIDRGAHRRRRADQRGMSAKRGRRAADRGGVRLVGERHRHPDETAGPVVEHLRRRRDRGGNFVAVARRHRDAPERPRSRGLRGKWLARPGCCATGRAILFHRSSETGPKSFMSRRALPCDAQLTARSLPV